MRIARPAGLLIAAVLGLLVVSTPAFADATLFVGTTTSPEHRTAKGFAIGAGLLIVGFEFEWSNTPERREVGAPSLKTGMGNVLLQSPFPVAGIQFYLTTGGGAYRETLGTRQETQFGFNTGGGAKVTLFGPLRARLDYRVFKLKGDPLYSTVNRVYAGLNLAF